MISIQSVSGPSHRETFEIDKECRIESFLESILPILVDREPHHQISPLVPIGATRPNRWHQTESNAVWHEIIGLLHKVDRPQGFSKPQKKILISTRHRELAFQPANGSNYQVPHGMEHFSTGGYQLESEFPVGRCT